MAKKSTIAPVTPVLQLPGDSAPLCKKNTAATTQAEMRPTPGEDFFPKIKNPVIHINSHNL